MSDASTGAELRWLSRAETGDSAAARAHDAVEAWLAGGTRERVLAESARRRVLCIAAPGGGPIAVKQFLAARPRRLRRRLQRAIGSDAASREWRALCALARAGVRVPQPLLRARRGDEDWLVTSALDGAPLAQWLGRGEPHGGAGASGRGAPAEPRPDARCEAPPAAGRRRLLRALGELVAALHGAGLRHGDLHVGNVLVAEGSPWLVDLERARTTRDERDRDRDLATLELSLARSGTSAADRGRVLHAALGERDTEAVRRHIADLARTLARDHARGRTRRCLVEGRRFARLESGAGRGMRLRALPDAAVRAALEGHARALAAGDGRVLKDDERARVTRVALAQTAGAAEHGLPRSAIVKEVVKGGPARRLADAVRGAPARRAWIAGHGLQARGIGAATPLAYLAGPPFGSAASFLLLEDVGEAPWLETPSRPPPDAIARRLGALLRALHESGVDHGDLQASHLFEAGPGDDRAAAGLRLIDLETVRFRRRCSDEQRLRSLAELNASLPDEWLDARHRRRAFARYCRALPFASGEAALREVVRRSLARGHHWRARDCDAARGLSPREP